MVSTVTTEIQPEIPWLKIMDHSDDEPIEIDPEFIFFLEEMEHK